MAGRRRNRPRRRVVTVGLVSRGGSRAARSVPIRGGQAQRTNPSVWVTGAYEFVVTSFTSGKSAGIWTAKLESVAGLKQVLTGVGEYRLLGITARWGPLTARADDRVALNPFLEDSNSYGTVAEFVGNGRRIRKGDTNFTESWNAATQPQIGAASPSATPVLTGGVNIFYQDSTGTAKTAGTSTAAIVTCVVRYSFRGRAANPGTVDAS